MKIKVSHDLIEFRSVDRNEKKFNEFVEAAT
jgi:hypothetical protein